MQPKSHAPAAVDNRDTAAALEPIWRLSVPAVWQRFWRESAAFILVCGYFFFEYVRPQTIYRFIDFLPYSAILLALTLLAWPSGADWRGLKSSQTTLVALFWLVMLASWAPVIGSESAADRMYIFFNWLLVYLVVTTVVTTRQRFYIFLLLFFLWNLKMSQHGAVVWAQRGFSYAGYGVSGPSGWFQNSGEYGAQMVMFAAMSWGFWRGARDYMVPWVRRLFLLVPITAAMSVIASNSRGDLLAGVAAVAWISVFSERISLKPLILGIFVLVAGYFVLPQATLDRFDTAGEDETSISRLARWEAGVEITQDNPILGIGPAQWMIVYPAEYPREPTREGWGIPHNMFIDAAAEFGYPGFILFVLMLLATFRINAKTRRIARQIDDSVTLWTTRGMDGATVGFIVAGFFMSVLYYPFLWVHIAMTVALRMCALNALESHAKMADQPDEAERGLYPSEGPRRRRGIAPVSGYRRSGRSPTAGVVPTNGRRR